MTCTALGDGCRQSARQVLELFELPSVCVHARSDSRSVVTRTRTPTRRGRKQALIAMGKEEERNPRAPCARRERTTSRAALLRAADTRRTALGLAAVDAVPVLRGHGPDAVALDVACLLARACAGTRLTRVRSIAPRETLVDQTRSREQRRVDGVGRRRPTVLAVAEEQISITLLVAPMV